MSGRNVPRPARRGIGRVKSISPDHGGRNKNDNTLPGSPSTCSGPRALSNGPAHMGGELSTVVDVWLYGSLARHAGKADQGSFANVRMRLPDGSTMADLLARLRMRTEERGITFINGQLSAMPGLQPDLGHLLHKGDRVAFFDLKSMWPFQYRHGAMLTDEMARAMNATKDHGLHHTYRRE